MSLHTWAVVIIVAVLCVVPDGADAVLLEALERRLRNDRCPLALIPKIVAFLI